MCFTLIRTRPCLCCTVSVCLCHQELQYALMQRAAAEQHSPPTKSQASFKGTANTCRGLKPRDTCEVRCINAQLSPAGLFTPCMDGRVLLQHACYAEVPEWPVVK